MPLAAGTRLGPYQVLGLIGAGGMGEVYKARDTRLDRTVAIKVLPAELSSDPERRARFEREAKTIAGLAHPHICTLYDVGEYNGSTYLVMEHLQGETLAVRLEKGRLPLDQALNVATEIAAALAAAHKQGIIHRDLKPGNVMLTKAGARLLDFGLAKLAGHGAEPAAAQLTSVATRSAPLTAEGTIVGTLQYMAPEQLEGKEADARTDLWALGAILYEMVTGKRAFEGDSAASLIGAILERDPSPVTTLQPLAPPGLDRFLRLCLAKSPDGRWDSAHDLILQLPALLGSPPATTGRASRRPWLVVVITVSIASAIAAGGLWVGRSDVTAPDPVIRFSIPTQGTQLPGGYWQSRFAISRDGRSLVYHSGTGLVVRSLDSFNERRLAGTADATQPEFSPDGQWIAFAGRGLRHYSAASGGLQKIAVTGGPITDLSPIGLIVGIAWGDDDRIYFGGSGENSIWRVPAGGGAAQAEQVTRINPGAGEQAHTWPQVIPGTSDLLYTALGPSGGSDDSRIVVETIGSGTRKTLVEHAMFARYLPTGRLVCARNDGTVFHVGYDASRREVTGSQTPLLGGVQTGMWGGVAMLSVSDTGTLAYVEGTSVGQRVLRRFDEKGRDLGRVGPEELWAGSARFSPVFDAGLRVAIGGANAPGRQDIWVHNLASSGTEHVTWEVPEDERAIWSPQGDRLAYSSAAAGASRNIFVRPLDARISSLVSNWPRHFELSSWSPDGRWLAGFDVTASSSSDAWAIPLDGGKPLPVSPGAASERWPVFSPDGRWIAYEGTEGGRPEIFVTSFSKRNVTRQVSTGGGTMPHWSHSGRRLYYISDDRLMALPVSLQGSLAWGVATPLFSAPGEFQDVSPDDRSFLFIVNNDDSPGSIRVVVNWLEELKKKVPLK